MDYRTCEEGTQQCAKVAMLNRFGRLNSCATAMVSVWLSLLTSFIRSVRSGMFGGAAVVGLMLYVSGIPRVQSDVLQVISSADTVEMSFTNKFLQKVPFVGRYFVKAEVHPQDNVREIAFVITSIEFD